MKNLLRYIKGLRRGKEAHHIELKAMEDSFLSDALDGYDAIEGNHLERISRLTKQIKNHGQRKTVPTIINKIPKIPKQKSLKTEFNISWGKWSVAASILICLSVGAYYLTVNYQSLLEYQLASITKHRKAESIAYEIDATDTVNIQQDSLLTVMPEPLLPPSDLIASAQALEERFREEREIEVVKLEAPSIQISDVADSPAAGIDAIYLADAKVAERLADTDKPVMIAMETSKSELDEVVATEYSAMKRKETAGSVAEVDTRDASKEKSTKPEPEIGMKAFRNYMKTSLIQPTDSICKDVKGKVGLRFSVNPDGNPYNIQITKSLCPTSNSEAIRLIQSGGKWKYGTETVEIEVIF